MRLRLLVTIATAAVIATVLSLAAPAGAATVDVDSNPPSPIITSRGDITFNPGSIVVTQDDQPIVWCVLIPGSISGIGNPGDSGGPLPSDGCHCDESSRSNDQSGGVTAYWNTSNGCDI